jgi:hypothetical protein
LALQGIIGTRHVLGTIRIELWGFAGQSATPNHHLIHILPPAVGHYRPDGKYFFCLSGTNHGCILVIS